MHHRVWHAIRVFLALLLVAPIGRAADVLPYLVGPGDVLDVDFPLKGTPADLQPLGGNGLTLIVVGNQVYFRYEATVASDGTITLPAMNPLRVDGLSVDAIRNAISANMKSFDLRGNLSVILARQNNSAFYVTGQVNHPGRYSYERPTSILEAITIAGGPSDNAKLSRVLLLRNGQSPKKLDLSYNTIRDNGVPDQVILPSDMVLVPRRWFTPDNTLVFLILSALGASVAVYAATR